MKSKKGFEQWLVGLIIIVAFLVLVLIWYLSPQISGWMKNAGGFIVTQQSKL